jgi:hypothetical protein
MHDWKREIKMRAHGLNVHGLNKSGLKTQPDRTHTYGLSRNFCSKPNPTTILIVNVLKQVLKKRKEISSRLEVLSKASRLKIFFTSLSVIIRKHEINVE